jgi:hypothetical protein
MGMKKIFLLAIVQMWLAACIPMYMTELPKVELDCHSMFGVPINALVEKEVEQQQLIKMIEEAYNIPENQIELRNFRDYEFWTGGDVWDIQWDKLGVNYNVSGKDSIIYRIDIRYQKQSQPSVKRVTDCLEELPQHYIAIYQSEVPPDAPRYYSASATLLFAEKGMTITSYENRPQPFIPTLTENTYIGRITYVKPGSSLQVYKRSISLSDNVEAMFEPQPWPGSWNEIQFIDTTEQ